MCRRRLKKYWYRLKELQKQKLNRDQLMMKIGAAKKEAGNAARLVELTLPKARQKITPETFCFRINKDKLRLVRRHEGQYWTVLDREILSYGGGGGNRTRVRRTSASKDYVCIRSVKFRERNVRTGRSAHPLFPKFRPKFRELNPDLSRYVTPRPVFTGKNGETWLSMQPELTDCQQLYLISTIFTSRGQLDTPLQPLDPRRIQCTPVF